MVVNEDVEHVLAEKCTMAAYRDMRPEALAPDGEVLVFAPPIVLGFIGAPLALAIGRIKRRSRSPSGKNWAKRRAYDG
jgi:hypothetical protein